MNSNKKNIINYTNNKLNIVVKLVYLQIKHPQSIFLRFLILVLNSKTELLVLTLAGRLFHIRRTSKVNSIFAVVGGLSSW